MIMKRIILLLLMCVFTFSNGQLLKDLGRALGNEVLRSAENSMEERAQRKKKESERLATERKEQKKRRMYTRRRSFTMRLTSLRS